MESVEIDGFETGCVELGKGALEFRIGEIECKVIDTLLSLFKGFEENVDFSQVSVKPTWSAECLPESR